MTRADHASGTDRIAEVARDARARATTSIVVNVQGDEPLIDARADPATSPHALAQRTARGDRDRLPSDRPMRRDAVRSQRGQGGARPRGQRAVLQPRADSVGARRVRRRRRDGRAARRACRLYRHIGIYAYRAAFLRAYPHARARADRALRGARAAARAVARPPHRGHRRRRPSCRRASTRRRTWSGRGNCSPPALESVPSDAFDPTP